MDRSVISPVCLSEFTVQNSNLIYKKALIKEAFVSNVKLFILPQIQDEPGWDPVFI